MSPFIIKLFLSPLAFAAVLSNNEPYFVSVSAPHTRYQAVPLHILPLALGNADAQIKTSASKHNATPISHLVLNPTSHIAVAFPIGQ